jgi:hypothetical protein
MRGINPANIPMLAQKDVCFDSAEAKFVFRIREGGVSIKENPTGKLLVAAVIGPAEITVAPEIPPQKQAVLLEVGIGRGRPYKEGNHDDRWTNLRRKWFFLTEEQYRLVAPEIFRLLQRLTNERVANWQFPNWEIPVPRRWWAQRGREFSESITFRFFPRGARFSVAEADKWLISDIYRAELVHNKALRGQLSGLSGFIDKALRLYPKNGMPLNSFIRLKGGRAVYTTLTRSSFLRHHKAEALLRLPAGRQHRFFYHLADIIGWDGDKTPERKKSDSALTDVIGRIGGMQLKVIREKRGCCVFEVFPDLPPVTGEEELDSLTSVSGIDDWSASLELGEIPSGLEGVSF